MEKRFTIVGLLLMLLLQGCMELQGSKDGLGSRKKIEEYLTKEVYDDFIESGFKIHTGDEPAWIVGLHEFTPVLVKSNLENDVMGRPFGKFTADYSNHDYAEASISVYNFDENGWYEYAEGYLTGRAEYFTLFYTVTYQRNEDFYTLQCALSGRINEEYEIVDYQLMRYMKDNPGIENIISTGSYRMYEEKPESEGKLIEEEKSNGRFEFKEPETL